MWTPRFGWMFLGYCLLCAPGVQADTVYKWVDAEGRINYGNAPPKEVSATPVETQISVVPSLNTAVSAPKTSASTPAAGGKTKPRRRPGVASQPLPDASEPRAVASTPGRSTRPVRNSEPPPERPRKQVEPCEPGTDCKARLLLPPPPN